MNNPDIIVEDGKLILSSSLVSSLNAVPGDRISIEYTELNNEIVPIIIKSEGGNKLTKSNTVSFRGKNNVSLSEFGTQFCYEENNGILYLKGDNPKYKIYTDVKTAVEHIDKSIIEDNRFEIETNFIL